MSATTVRVEAKVKAELDRLQGILQAETGRRLSHSELLARLVRFASRRSGSFLKETEAKWRPPTPQELRILLAPVRDLDVETDVTKIDQVLYGGAED